MPRRPRKRQKSSSSFSLGVALVFLGIILLNPLPALKKNNASSITIDPKLMHAQKDGEIPVRIVIPATKMDLPVTVSKVKNGFWEVSESTASYGEGSAKFGERGNMVIFAHARAGLFINLKDVKEKDAVFVFAKSGWKRYIVKSIKSVYPNQTEVIKPTKDETLTLYTCTGFLDEKRLIVVAVPEN